METTQKWYELFRTNPGSNTPRNISSMATYYTSQKSSKQDEQDMRGTAREARTYSWVTFYYGPLDIDVRVLADKQELIYCSVVRTQNKDWKNCRGRWMIGTGGEKKLGKCMLSERLDDDALPIIYIYIK